MVCFKNGIEDGTEAKINIRINFVTYNPGLHSLNGNNEVVCTPDGEGWRDLINFMDKALEELEKNQIIKGLPLNPQ